MALPSWASPLLLPAELGRSDRYAIDDRAIAGATLMQHAGRGLAGVALRSLPAGPIVVLCGPGNNGGDGIVAAGVLHELGRDVRLVMTRDPGLLKGDAAGAMASCVLEPERWAGPEMLDGASGAIDALLGTGAHGAPHGVEADVIDALLARPELPVVACDLPSGIDAGTGEVAAQAVRAVATATFHAASPGHLIAPAKAHVGRLEVIDIGIPPGAPVTPGVGAINAPILAGLPTRAAGANKFTAGVVVMVAGSPEFPGAAVLATRGAQRAGAGYVIAVVPEASAAALHVAAPEVIVTSYVAQAAAPQLVRRTLEQRGGAVVVGPGLGRSSDAEALVRSILASDRPVVVDADGLAPFAGAPELLRRTASTVLTPHAGELARLLGGTSRDVSARRLAAARELAERSAAIVVLKGDDSIVAAPGELVCVNRLPAPALAVAGTGDVLAGAVGALLASGLEPFTAAAGAVYLHARAGRLAAQAQGGVDGVVALDVADRLPAARGVIGGGA